MNLSIESVGSARAKLWDAGFRPVPILNFDARVPSPGKQPIGDGWREAALRDPPFCLTIPPVPHALNSGILCDGLRPIDLDIDDDALARRIRAMAVDRFGECPVRMRRNSPRCLMLYRAAAGAPPKISITGATHSKTNGCKVEVLGAGQQFVALGRHDSGAELEWFPEAPGDTTLESLPALTEGEVFQFLTDIAPLLGAAPPTRSNGHDHHAVVAGELQAEPLRVAAAVAAISNTGAADWEWWNKIGMAIWAATGGSAIGGEIFSEWSKRNPVYDAEETEARWRHYRRSPPDHIGAGTLFHLAGETFRSTFPTEEPPEVPSDPAWWHSLEQSLLADQGIAEVAEVHRESSDEPPQDSRDGLVINPPVHWTAPAPLRQWLIEDWIPIGYVTGLYGDGGIGKSLIAQQLLCSVALAMPWLGLDVRGGRAFGFMCEDDASELHRRQEGINRAYGIEMANLENMRIAARLGFDNLLMTFDQDNRGKPTDRFTEICRFLDVFRPRLVVLDTLADIFGGNEINRNHARQFIQGVGGQIARQYDCAVVIPAHPSAAGLASGSGTSGSTAWNNTFRSRLYITRPEDESDGDKRLISRMKSNYAPKGGEITAVWENGAFANVVTARTSSASIPWDHIEAIFREIDRAWRAREPWSSEPQTKRWGRYLPLWAFTHLGVKEKTAKAWIEGWLTEGFLKRDVVDGHNKQWGLRVLKWLQPPVSGNPSW